MANFKYSAKTKDGKTQSGVINALSREAAMAQLGKQGMRPLFVTAESANKKSLLKLSLGSPRVKLAHKVVFTRQLSTMVNAGVPLARSLHTLAEQTDSKALKQYLPEVTKDIEGGTSLGDALAKYPKVFDPIFVNMVRAGETGGILDDVLKRLANQMEKDAKIRGKLKSAMTYPAVITFVTISAFFFLMTNIVPKIGEIALSVGGDSYDPPLYTKAMLGFSSFLINNGKLLGVGLVVLIIFLVKFVRTKKGRRIFHKILLKTPIIGTIITKVAIARFARIFSALSAAGVPIVESLKVTSGAISNAIIESELENAIDAVTAGKPLSSALINSNTFPPIVGQMALVGEETGDIGEVLVKIADFYEEDVERLADSLASIIEPVMIVVLGLMVGLIAFSVFGPLSELTDSVRDQAK